MFKEIQEQIQKNIQEPILKIFFEKYSGVYNILTQNNKKIIIFTGYIVKWKIPLDIMKK